MEAIRKLCVIYAFLIGSTASAQTLEEHQVDNGEALSVASIERLSPASAAHWIGLPLPQELVSAEPVYSIPGRFLSGYRFTYQRGPAPQVGVCQQIVLTVRLSSPGGFDQRTPSDQMESRIEGWERTSPDCSPAGRRYLGDPGSVATAVAHLQRLASTSRSRRRPLISCRGYNDESITCPDVQALLQGRQSPWPSLVYQCYPADLDRGCVVISFHSGTWPAVGEPLQGWWSLQLYGRDRLLAVRLRRAGPPPPA